MNKYSHHSIQNRMIRLMMITGALLLSVFFTQAQTAQRLTKIHFRPEPSKSGDVIPFYHKGVYHVFYMRDSKWGHIISTDLVHWNELPDAIQPGVDSLGPDGEGCWTGSVVEDQGLFYLFYTGKNSRDVKGDQKVMLATSKDLVHWTKEPRHTFYADGNIYWNKTINGQIDDKLTYHHQAFRDPDVFWNKEKNEWWMILHATLADPTSPVTGLYTSKDLINWKPSKPLVVYPLTTNVSNDCPFVFSSQGKWLLNFADYHYRTADQLEGPYSEVKIFDCGDLRVPKVMWDGQRFILIGWILDYDNKVDSGDVSWGGTLCMPRELWIDSSGNEFQRPVKEIIESFQSLGMHRSGKFVKERGVTIPKDFMFHAQVKAKTATTKLAIRFFHDKRNDDNGYHLNIDFNTRQIELGSRYKAYKRVCEFDPAKPVDVRIFLLGNVLECFINDAFAFTMHAYEKNGDKMSIASPDGMIQVLQYEVFKPL